MPSATPRAASTLAKTLFNLVSLVLRQRPRDLSLTAGSTLASLQRNGPGRITQLALTEGVAQPSMTALVAQLERLGLVERRHDPTDGRVVLVAITEGGTGYLDEARRGMSELLTTVLAELPDDEVAALEAAVPALVHLLELADLAATRGPGALEGAGR